MHDIGPGLFFVTFRIGNVLNFGQLYFPIKHRLCVMSMNQHMSVRDFGANDRPDCPMCGQDMYLSSRTTHPQLGSGYEFQIFSCKACDYEDARTANQDGEYSC